MNINVTEILQSPRQFCDLETFIALAEQLRDAEKQIADFTAQQAEPIPAEFHLHGAQYDTSIKYYSELVAALKAAKAVEHQPPRPVPGGWVLVPSINP